MAKKYWKASGVLCYASRSKEIWLSTILGNLAQVLPGKMITKGVYKNRNGHLPTAPGRIWYEADINYKGGFRGMTRVVYSNDGLIFVTYNHYFTFEAIV